MPNIYNLTDNRLEVNCVESSVSDSICISCIMNKWLERNENNIKISTYEKYRAIINNHIEPLLCDISILQLTPEILHKFSDKLLQKPLSKSTANDVLLVLNMGLSFAEKEYKLNCVRADFFKYQKAEMRILSKNEQTVFTEYLITKNDIYSFGILLSLFTGIRIGELCALEWDDIKEGTITINKTMQRINRKIQILPPKTQSSVRIIPVPSALKSIIENKRTNKNYVLERENGKITEPRLMQIKFKEYAADCGIENINFHALRHTFATRCVELGFDIKTLSEILGHSDVKTTLNKYVHSSLEQKIKNMDKLQLNIAI